MQFKLHKSFAFSLNLRVCVDKPSEPQSIEQQCYKSWEEAGLFKASGSGDPYYFASATKRYR